MSKMFQLAEQFNQPIINWEITKDDVNDYLMYDLCPISEENKASKENYEKHVGNSFLREVAPVSGYIRRADGTLGKRPVIPTGPAAEIGQYLGLSPEVAYAAANKGQMQLAKEEESKDTTGGRKRRTRRNTKRKTNKRGSKRMKRLY
jgi:hypothetical protein